MTPRRNVAKRTMFIGHFAVAYILVTLFPAVPPLVPLFGVSFPDLLWPLLVLSGREKVEIDPGSPLQSSIRFVRYPFSHSLVFGTLIAGIAGAALAVLFSPLAGIVFVGASASHWLLDSITHVRDLPVLGFGRDRKVGLALWTRPRAAFFIELILYAAVTLVAADPGDVVPLLVLGTAFHLVNANSFFGFSKANPFNTPGKYAAIALIGFLTFILIANAILVG
ncbi:MAG TPA: hypothetical protein PLO06_00625 [Methanoregulaceae archaeon]|nr:hypothetical protein [Methanoregulaceae archaeon]HPD75300.1 hypothetical protein [Methanoregulaceae archaeon]